MATRRILHPQWRDDREPTKYPFADIASLTNARGDFIPETCFLDAVFYPVGGAAELYLSEVNVTSETITLILGDTNSKQRCRSQFPLLTPPDGLRFTDAYGRPAGLLVSEAARLMIFQAWANGIHSFKPEETAFAATCCIPTPEIGLRGILLDDDSLLTGDVWLMGDNGVVLTTQESLRDASACAEDLVADQIIRIDVVGDPLFGRRLCDEQFAEPRFLRTITAQTESQTAVCGPDVFGDFKLSVGSYDAVDTVLRVRSTSAGILIEIVGKTLIGNR